MIPPYEWKQGVLEWQLGGLQETLPGEGLDGERLGDNQEGFLKTCLARTWVRLPSCHRSIKYWTLLHSLQRYGTMAAHRQ